MIAGESPPRGRGRGPHRERARDTTKDERELERKRPSAAHLRTGSGGVSLACPDCGDVDRGHVPGCPAAAAVEAVCEADRIWFATHPGAASSERAACPGDYGVSALVGVRPTADDDDDVVVVMRIAEGVPTRAQPEIVFWLDERGRPTLCGAYVLDLLGRRPEDLVIL